ncbi:MAG: hypothetical protein JNL28_15630 [Planctomycetes bacterium]|nr:hypothetical protein [Planctomycetota bacterium]
MTTTTDSIPAGNSQPTPATIADSGRVPVATTVVLFAIVLGLLAFIAIV